MIERDMQKAALRGEPSYVWRDGQERRLEMISRFAGERVRGRVLENGCGVGVYVEKLSDLSLSGVPSALRGTQSKGCVIGLEYDFERALDARVNSDKIINAA